MASNLVLNDGTVSFNRLIALNGVKSIDLNGFNLSADVTPAVAQSRASSSMAASARCGSTISMP